MANILDKILEIQDKILELLKDKKIRIIVISIAILLLILLILIITFSVISKDKSIPASEDEVFEVIEHEDVKADKFLDIKCIEEKLKTSSLLLEDNVGKKIDNEQEEFLLKLGVLKEEISDFKVYTAEELLKVDLLTDEDVFFYFDKEAEKIIAENEKNKKDENQKYIDSEGRYIITKSEKYLINKSEKVVFLVNPRDGKYANEIIIQGKAQKSDSVVKNVDNDAEKSSSSGEDDRVITKASLIKLGTLRYRAILEFPEEAKDKKYMFDNGISEEKNETPNSITITEINSNTSNKESKFSIYRDKIIVNENGKLMARYLNAENKEVIDVITIDFIRFSEPIFTEVENTIKFSNIDNTENKKIKYQLARADIDITNIQYEFLELELENIDKEALIYEEVEFLNNLIDQSQIETGIYFIKVKVMSDGKRNILDSKEITKSFINKDGQITGEANFDLETVLINDKAINNKQLEILMNTGELELTVASNINNVKIKASAKDTNAIVLGANTYSVPTVIELKVQVDQEYKIYNIIINKKGSANVDKSNIKTSTQVKNNNTYISSNNTNSTNDYNTNKVDMSKPQKPNPIICIKDGNKIMEQTNGYYNGWIVNKKGVSVKGLQIKAVLPEGATGVEYTMRYDGDSWIPYREMAKDDPNYNGYTVTIAGDCDIYLKFRSYKKVGNTIIYSDEVVTEAIRVCVNHSAGKTNWLNDSSNTKHWRECKKCKYRFDYGDCTSDGTWYRDDLKTMHWQKCKICNNIMKKEQCVKNPHVNTGMRYWECRKCRGLVVDEQDIEILTKTIFGEAGNQSYEGKLAVGYVVINRVSNTKFGAGTGREKKISTVCDCPGQFNGYWAAKNMNYASLKNTDSHKAALQVIKEFQTSGYNDVTVNTSISPYGAMYFHATYVHPGWSYKKLKTIGAHIFYIDLSKVAAENWQS